MKAFTRKADIAKDVEENPNKFTSNIQRKCAKEYIPTILSAEDAEQIFPVKKPGRYQRAPMQEVALQMAKDEHSAVEIMQYIADTAKTPGSCMSTVTLVKKLLYENNYVLLADFILQTDLYKSKLQETRANASEVLENKEPFDRPALFKDKQTFLENCMPIIEGIINNTQEMTRYVLMYAIVNFSA